MQNMEIAELKKIVQENGIVGAGGAGFPTYGKIDERANIIILNCAECEPLLKLHRQLLKKHAYEIMKTFQMLADTVKATEAVIGIKEEYQDTILTLQEYLGEFPNMRLQLLPSVYPMGDEVVLIYEATGRVIRPGGLPIEAGVAVFNVETIYNMFRAVEQKYPVIDKIVTVVGEVEHPISVRVPIGCSIQETVRFAGNMTTKNPVFLIGGPMMGALESGTAPITKTTNAILVLPEEHRLIQKKKSSNSLELKRAASICCQCEECTHLCPRNLLGHPINPSLFMRSAANQDFQDINVFLDTFFCCGCGICELYACPQTLSPRTLIMEYKNGLRKAGIKMPQVTGTDKAKPSREYRKIPEKRLEARLGLTKYNIAAPLQDERASVSCVVEKLSQHIGSPAIAVVQEGQMVKAGDLIAKAADGLSVAIHASIAGKVTAVRQDAITIHRIGQEVC